MITNMIQVREKLEELEKRILELEKRAEREDDAIVEQTEREELED